MIKAIVCVDSNFGIGKNNDLLFNIPEDMKFFRETTSNKDGKPKIIVYGFNTYKSLPKSPLPNRLNVVLWDKATSIDCLEGCLTFNNFKDLLYFVQTVSKYQDVFICGGGTVYKLFLDYYDECLVTYVDYQVGDATVFFPNLDKDDRFEITKVDKKQDENYKYEFRTYTRRK